MSCPVNHSNEYQGEMEYSKYLQLPTLLDTINPVSWKGGKIAHDEHFFARTHQAFELWFDQILFELNSILELFSDMPGGCEANKNGMIIANRLQRIVKIIELQISQFMLLETMTPLDFMDFRSYMYPASGFQSLQFRLLEIKLGLKEGNRKTYDSARYKEQLGDDQKTELTKSLEKPSLDQVVQRWLERIIDNECENFDFPNEYKKAVTEWQEGNTEKIKPFEIMFDEEKYKEDPQRRFTYNAFVGAMLVTLYRDEPKFSLPYQILTLLTDLESAFAKWRYVHVQMAHRMRGKTGPTGGCVNYLQSTVCEDYMVFLDLYNLSVFLLPQKWIPSLPTDVKKRWSLHDS